MERFFEDGHAVVLEFFEFRRSGFAGHDFEEFMLRLAVKDRADHEARWHCIPHQLAGAVRALGEFLGGDVEEDAAALNPPIQNLAPRKARPHAMNRPIGANSGNFTTGATGCSLDFENRAHGASSALEALNGFLFQNADIGEVPVLLVVVEPVADNEFVGDIEPDIIGFRRLIARHIFP